MRRPLELLPPAEEDGKWPDQSGQSRLCRTASEFVEVGEATERRSPKENMAVTKLWNRDRMSAASISSSLVRFDYFDLEN